MHAVEGSVKLPRGHRGLAEAGQRQKLILLPCVGMTIKFFGLFFYERCGLSPVAVSLLATVAPFLVSGASFAAQWGSKWCVHT